MDGNTTKTGKIPVSEVASLLGVAPVTVRGLIDSGQLPGMRIKRKSRTTYIIIRSVFEAWLGKGTN